MVQRVVALRVTGGRAPLRGRVDRKDPLWPQPAGSSSGAPPLLVKVA